MPWREAIWRNVKWTRHRSHAVRLTSVIISCIVPAQLDVVFGTIHIRGTPFVEKPLCMLRIERVL